ncbi:MAG: hypothetical protein ACK5PS_05215 [Desulfopila sp.]
MKKYKLRIRVFDADMVRLRKACININSVMRSYDIDAQVIPIDEHLEIYRMGLAEQMPAMEVNGHILTVCLTLEKNILLQIFKPLAENT